MKFGKRLAAEAARRWRPYYLDYKACKRAIQQDVHANGARPCSFCRGRSNTVFQSQMQGCIACPVWQLALTASSEADGELRTCTDARGRNFEAVLRHELAKISAFYADKEAELEVRLLTSLQNPCGGYARGLPPCRLRLGVEAIGPWASAAQVL